MRGWRLPDLQVAERRVCARALLRPLSRTAGPDLAHERRRHLGAGAWWPRSAEGVRRLPAGSEHQRPAHRDPGQDGQGLWHG
ncbi:hypothetical protein G6F22_019172 [Rhizopus arrhizus]|nr:hypothetical protein G6F22_019172 [Rhizopus arrhizus]KAG1059221.1 hypothetical protein G6F40_018173 [Rhizopus arrhizus]